MNRFEEIRKAIAFPSSPATNAEQSSQLLAVGLSPWTADCYIEEGGHIIVARDDYDLEVALKLRKLPPAWTLHRLVSLLPPILLSNAAQQLVLSPPIVQYYDLRTERCLVQYSDINIYENLTNIIVWLRTNGYINPIFLKDK